MSKNIVITGFMGTGKTTVGKEVARVMNRAFFDTDQILQDRARMSVTEIFEKLGEEYFRKLENRIITELHKKTDAVIATG
ncbi:MAG: shikimate kinase, partial [Candidatus Zixiibacteriota bacterium]